MRLEISRDQLLPLLQPLLAVVEKRQTLAILSNIRVEARDGRLRLTSTDLEVELIAGVEADVQEEGATTVQARKLADIVRHLPDGATLSFALEKDRAVLRSGRSRFALSTLAPEDFPEVESIGPSEDVTLPQGVLRGLIERTQFSMAQHDVRYYLNGLLLELDRTGTRAVATDGHRLALAESAIGADVQEPRQIIVPRKGVHELVRLLADTDEPATVQFGAQHLRAELGAVRLTSKLIEGRFPDYHRVIPQEGDKHVLVERDALRQALSRVYILSNEKYRGVRFAVEGDRLVVGSHNPEQEEAEEELEVEYGGPRVELGFNANYLLEALGAMRTDRTVITLTDAQSSGLLQAEGDDSARYVVMPMRL